MPKPLRSNAGRRIRLNLPENSGLPEIEAARVELERLTAKQADAGRQRQELLVKLEVARREDLAAAGQAIRAGKAEPKTRRVDAVQDELRKLEQHAAAIEEALDQVEEELIAQIEEQRDSRIADLTTQINEACAGWRAQIAAAEQHLERINTLSSLRRFLSNFPNVPAGFRRGVFGHVDIDGPVTPETALRALATAFDPPAASLPTMPQAAPRLLRNPRVTA